MTIYTFTRYRDTTRRRPPSVFRPVWPPLAGQTMLDRRDPARDCAGAGTCHAGATALPQVSRTAAAKSDAVRQSADFVCTERALAGTGRPPAWASTMDGQGGLLHAYRPAAGGSRTRQKSLGRRAGGGDNAVAARATGRGGRQPLAPFSSSVPSISRRIARGPSRSAQKCNAPSARCPPGYEYCSRGPRLSSPRPPH